MNSFVTIDLGGWTIFQNGLPQTTGRSTGIIAHGDDKRNITVRNGTVTGFTNAINLATTFGAIVENLFASGELSGIVAGRQSIVRGNVATGKEGAVGAGPGSIINDNTVIGSFIALYTGPFNTVRDNNVTGDIGITAGIGSNITGNNVHTPDGGTGVDGITVTCPSHVVGNIVTGHQEKLKFQGVGCTDIDNLAP